MSRANSMTSAGQCRLAPLIPCIQDASKLYDYCVKILFKLHSALPPDILQGHRDRFFKQFKDLRSFYQNTNNLQYFRDLITVPPLPEVKFILQYFSKDNFLCSGFVRFSLSYTSFSYLSLHSCIHPNSSNQFLLHLCFINLYSYD